MPVCVSTLIAEVTQVGIEPSSQSRGDEGLGLHRWLQPFPRSLEKHIKKRLKRRVWICDRLMMSGQEVEVNTVAVMSWKAL